MDTAPSPLLPAFYDLVWFGALVVVIALAVAALVSLARRASNFTPGIALVWTLVIVLIPIVGALAWLFVGARTVRADGAH